VLAAGFEALRLDDLAADAGITKPAVIKSVGGKASILLALSEEDRQTRIALIRQAIGHRTALKRRLTELTTRLFELDRPRLNLVQAYIGYLWFWRGDEHDRAQRNIDELLAIIGELIVSGSTDDPTPARARTLSLRLLAGYVIALRDICYGRSTVPEAVRTVIDFALE
jgi:AcrR family transcriptional regulator